MLVDSVAAVGGDNVILDDDMSASGPVVIAIPAVVGDSIVGKMNRAQVGIEAVIKIVDDQVMFDIGSTAEIVPDIDSDRKSVV